MKTKLFSLILALGLYAAVAQNNVLHFDGSNDHVSVPHNTALNLVNLYTFEALVFPTGSNHRTILSKGDGNGLAGNGDYIFQVTATGQLALYATLSNQWIYSPANSVLNGMWSHVAATNDGSTVKLYVNGALLTTSTVISSGNNPGTNPFYLGRQGTGCNCNYMDGALDEVRVWNLARTQTQIQSSMLTGLVGNETGLLAYYRFSQGAASGNNTGITSATDLTSNNFNGTLTNFALTGSTSNFIGMADALNFDGSNDYGITPNLTAQIGLSSNITIEAWFKATAAGVIMNEFGASTVPGAWHLAMIEVVGSGTVMARTYNLTAINLGTVSFGTWNHIAVRYNHTKGLTEALLNGKISPNSASGSRTSPISNSLAQYYGFGAADANNMGSGAAFNGSLDEVRIWNTFRTDCEIQSYMNCEIPTNATGLVANYHFNQGLAALSNTTTSLVDYSGNAFHGSLFNFANTGTVSNWVAQGGVISGFSISAPPTASVSVNGNGNSITYGGVTTSTLNYTDFGAATSKTFVIQNSGTGTLSIGKPYFTGAAASLFSLSTIPNATLAASATTSFVVVFTPTAGGTQTATVNFADNDCSKPVFNYIIQGTPPNADALDFDGIDDHVTIAHNAALNLVNVYTFEAWIKPNAGSFRTIVAKGIGNGVAGNGDYIFQVTGTGQLALYATISNAWIYSSASAITNSVWSHVAVTNNGTAVRFYVNGALITSSTVVAGTSNPGTGPFYIGRQGSGGLGNMMYGNIDEVRVWSTARTQCEINTFKNCEIPTTATGLIANYHFTHGAPSLANPTATLLTDASGSTNTGTLTTMALTGSASNWISPGGVVAGFTTALAPITVGASVNNSVICNGTSVTFNGSGANTYAWTGGVTNNVAFAPTSSGTFVVTGTNTLTTCTNTASQSLTVNPLPTITVNSGSICSGKSFTIVPAGANTYTVQGGNTIVSPITNSTYTVSGTSTANCVSSTFATANVTVNITPTITVNSGTICAGQSFTIVPAGASTYTVQGNNTIVNPSSSSNYTVAGTSTAGCVSSTYATAGVTVNANPTITVNSGSICSGQSFTIIPGGANTYTVQGGNTIVNPIGSANYTVTGTSTAGCISQGAATSTVTVNANPTITVNSGSICAGQSFTITPGGASTYTIQGGNNAVSPVATTAYTVSGTNTAGCSSQNTATANVTVNANPTITANNGTICPGQSFTLSPTGASTYTYSGGSNVVTPLSSTVFTITGSSAAGCNGVTQASITVNPLPTITVNGGTICKGQSFTLNPSGASTYTYSGGSAIVNPTTTSSYTIGGTDAKGCLSFTMASVAVDPCTGVYQLSTLNPQAIVYPNPTNGSLTVQVNSISENMIVEIYNSIGQLLASEKIENINTGLHFESAASGIYSVRVSENGKNIFNTRVIKQ